jgi:hypothetical protein
MNDKKQTPSPDPDDMSKFFQKCLIRAVVMLAVTIVAGPILGSAAGSVIVVD